MIVNGVEWLTTSQAAARLGDDVTPDLIRDWRRRGLIQATLVRQGRVLVAWYRLADLIEVEFLTRDRTKPRRASLDKIAGQASS